LSKYFPDKGVKTDEEKAKEFCISNPLVTDLLASIKKDAGTVDSTIVTNRVNRVLEQLDLSGEDKKVVTNFLHSKANTTHGIRRENKTVQHMIDSGIYTKLVKDNRFHAYTILETETIHFCLVGRVDRLDIDTDGTTTLIEIKNRKNQMFEFSLDGTEVMIDVSSSMTGTPMNAAIGLGLLFMNLNKLGIQYTNFFQKKIQFTIFPLCV
jgi:hypothetical protein